MKVITFLCVFCENEYLVVFTVQFYRETRRICVRVINNYAPGHR